MENNNHTTTKVWYTHYGGYIVKSYLNPHTNRIIEEKIPFNQPNNFTSFLNNYFQNKLR